MGSSDQGCRFISQVAVLWGLQLVYHLDTTPSQMASLRGPNGSLGLLCSVSWLVILLPWGCFCLGWSMHTTLSFWLVSILNVSIYGFTWVPASFVWLPREQESCALYKLTCGVTETFGGRSMLLSYALPYRLRGRQIGTGPQLRPVIPVKRIGCPQRIFPFGWTPGSWLQSSLSLLGWTGLCTLLP